MKIGLIAISILFAISSCAQHEKKAEGGYHIDFQIEGLRDTTLFLGYYYGESTYLADTAEVNGKGEFYFEGKDELPQGVYFLVLDKTRLFDIVIGGDQHFSMKTSAKDDDYIGSMTVEGDDDNLIFFQNMLFNAKSHKKADPAIAVLTDSLASEEEKEKARVLVSEVDKEVLVYQNSLIAKYPKALTARWIKATQEVIIPDSLGTSAESPSAAARYTYYRDHFFDNFDLSDDALIRLPTPLYYEKLVEYLDQLVPPHPDSIVVAITQLANKVKHNQETYKYLIWNALTHYQKPKFMGLDKVYVALYDDYFASGEMDFWIGDGIKKNVQEYADRLRLSLIGNKAPNLVMQGPDLRLRSMYDIKSKYTLIFFFDPDCGHCRVETPKLTEFYNENKKRFDLEVYAVSLDTSMQKMRDYIKDMEMPWITVNGPRSTVGPYNKLYDVFSSPTLYVLDENKKIIAKKPPIEILADFLENYEKVQKRKAEAKTEDEDGSL